MPKVLRIINRFNLGGPTFNAAYLTKYMAPEFETLLVGGVKEESEDSSEFILQSLGVEPNYIENMGRQIDFSDDRKAYKQIKDLIKQFKPDIVHTHASKAGALGRLAASKLQVPVILHTFHGHVFHSYFGKAKTTAYKAAERYLSRKSTRIIAISETQKRELANIHKICPKSKIEVIPLGFDLTKFSTDQDTKRKKFRSEFKVEDDELAIVIIGRLVPVKNHKLFIEAIKHVSQRSHNTIRAFIVGDGELKSELVAYAREVGLDHSMVKEKPATLQFTSWIKDVDEVLAGSDIVCLSSLNEGTPVTLIEAQAAGKPIVTTNVGGVKDIVLENRSALLTRSESVEDFSYQLLKLTENPDFRQSLSGEGKAFVEEKFNYHRLVNDMKKLYTSLL